MEIAYGLGPENNEVCWISTNQDEFYYDIRGLPFRPRMTHDERRELLIQIVGGNAPIQHTHVIFLAQELGFIAKKTIEKELNDLEKDGLLESDKEGESPNAPRKWRVKPPEFDLEKYAKKETKNIIESLENYIQIIEKNYEKFNKVQKDYAMANLLEIMHCWQPIIEITNQETRIKNEKRKFDSLVKRAYDILWYEKRDHVDTRQFLRRLLHLKASESLVTMNKFLEEIK